jgi:hypothetical protein
MRIFQNSKRAEVSVVSKLIITMIVLGLLIYGYKKITDGTTKVLQCKTQEGRCTPGTCDFQSEIPVLSGKAAGCDKDEICCVDISKGGPNPDPGCTAKIEDLGNKCQLPGSTTSDGYCDYAGKCINQCEFCEKYGSDKATIVAKKTSTICSKKYIDKFNDQSTVYGCSCETELCSEADYQSGTCIRGYCSTATTAICCSK